ncbi:hypothetical protein GJAV_G00175280 [Gymnothorax javanicus]|nr:hypothetical protein GJAV_G00175280 [Gymnothorax javanicus]
MENLLSFVKQSKTSLQLSDSESVEGLHSLLTSSLLFSDSFLGPDNLRWRKLEPGIGATEPNILVVANKFYCIQLCNTQASAAVGGGA